MVEFLYVRPGPETIEPATAPGGIVIHIYDLEGDLILTRGLGPEDPTGRLATMDARETAETLAASGHTASIIVAYDGDTGRRFSKAELALAMAELS